MSCHSPLGREGGRGVTHRLAARGEGVSLTAWPRRIVRAARCRAGPRLRLRLRPRLQSPSGRRPASRWRPRARSRHWRTTAPAPGGSGRRRLQAHCCSRRRQARRCRRILLRVGLELLAPHGAGELRSSRRRRSSSRQQTKQQQTQQQTKPPPFLPFILPSFPPSVLPSFPPSLPRERRSTRTRLKL